tara:strand:- start:94 stop:354 length:261 start_codon:yes stop_codon:yes gene_type:complete
MITTEQILYGSFDECMDGISQLPNYSLPESELIKMCNNITQLRKIPEGEGITVEDKLDKLENYRARLRQKTSYTSNQGDSTRRKGH